MKTNRTNRLPRNSIKNKSHNKAKWDDKNYLKIYLYTLEGFSKRQIAKLLGVSMEVFQIWIKKYPAAYDAWKQAKEKMEDPKETTFINYVYGMMPAKIKKYWDELKECESAAQIDLLIGRANTKVRQHLWVHALVSSNFNMSRACKRTNIPVNTILLWKKLHPNFKALIDEINEHKKNFFEESLVKKVREGDVSCILFANRTMNRDRGYGDKTQVEITGNLNHNHTNLLNLDELDLPAEILQVILEQVRKQREAKMLADRGEPDRPVGVLDYVMSDGKAVPEEEGEKNGSPVHQDEED